MLPAEGGANRGERPRRARHRRSGPDPEGWGGCSRSGSQAPRQSTLLYVRSRPAGKGRKKGHLRANRAELRQATRRTRLTINFQRQLTRLCEFLTSPLAGAQAAGKSGTGNRTQEFHDKAISTLNFVDIYRSKWRRASALVPGKTAQTRRDVANRRPASPPGPGREAMLSPRALPTRPHSRARRAPLAVARLAPKTSFHFWERALVSIRWRSRPLPTPHPARRHRARQCFSIAGSSTNSSMSTGAWWRPGTGGTTRSTG